VRPRELGRWGALFWSPEKIMSDLSDHINDFITSVRRLQARTHAEIGIVAAAIIEEKLTEALLTKMRPLSGEMKKRLFEGYGPLSSFSAKIDLSFALQVIDTQARSDLTVVRKIRNQFAHSVSLVNFTSPGIVAHFQHFNLPQGESDYQGFYLRKLKEIDIHLDHIIQAGPTMDTRSSV
jgi:hypothetical protein